MNDGTIHGATIEALQDRLDSEDDPQARERLQAVIDWIEDDPDAFWDRFAGPMLDDLEAHA